LNRSCAVSEHLPAKQGRGSDNDINGLALSRISRRRKLIQSRQLSSVQATQAQLDRIGRLDGALKSYAHLTGASVLEQAHAAEKEIASGKVRGPLHGAPISVKHLC
jgi:amidase